MKYQLLPHTADIRMKITANSLPELFQAALQGMGQILKEGICRTNTCDIQQPIKISANDQTCLLIDFLSEALSLGYTERAVFCRVEFSEFSNTTLCAVLKGNKVLYFDEEIKAVTYHEAEIEKNHEGLWESMVVFDI